MTADRSGEIAILRAGCWWDSDQLCDRALNWYAANAGPIHKIPANRWESFQRAGEGQRNYEAFRTALTHHMWECYRDKDGIEQTRYRHGFTEQFSHDLLAEMERAIQTDRGSRAIRAGETVQGLPEPEAVRLGEEWTLRKAREFLAALVLQIRLTAGAKEKSR